MALQLPIVVGGLLMIVLAVFLASAMTEEGFKPTPPEERTTRGMMAKTLRDTRQLVRRQPILLVLPGTNFFHGLYSEGFERLWTAHLADSFQRPWQADTELVLWFGLIRGVMLAISLATTEVARRHVDTRRSEPTGRVLLINAAYIVLTLTGFGLTRTFGIALVLYWLIGAMRSVAVPLHTARLNLGIEDSRVRATVLSASGQADAVGQPAGVVGNIPSGWRWSPQPCSSHRCCRSTPLRFDGAGMSGEGAHPLVRRWAEHP